MARAQWSQELAQRDGEGVGEGVPGGQRVDRAVLLDLDQSLAGQSSARGEFVIAPPVLRTQTGQGEPECRRVGLRRRDDRHGSIRRCRPLPYCAGTDLLRESRICTTVAAPGVAWTQGRRLTAHGLEGAMSVALSARAWTVTISRPAGRPVLTCSACPQPLVAAGAAGVVQVRRHLAGHLAESRLPAYLGTCQCRERTCAWHGRQGPCSGPLRLLLIRADRGLTWHLADTCTGCAAAIPCAATVPEPPQDAALDHVRTPAGETVADYTWEPVEWVEAR